MEREKETLKERWTTRETDNLRIKSSHISLAIISLSASDRCQCEKILRKENNFSFLWLKISHSLLHNLLQQLSLDTGCKC